MPIVLTSAEKKIARALAKIKQLSGSHSPSPAMLSAVPGVAVQYDFCYLSNPYATDLFLARWKKDFQNNEEAFRKLVERYPSPQGALATKVGKMLRVSPEMIFLGHGATEVIQAVLHRFAEKKMVVPVPTFSPYLEFAPAHIRVCQFPLQQNDSFTLHVPKLLAFVKKEAPDTVVLINPNNPDGGYLSLPQLRQLLTRLRGVKTVIVDESFIHFVDEGRVARVSAERLVGTFPNLVVIKSLSKDFGIAGLRLGYAVMSPARRRALLSDGFLWNISGFGEYFLGLLGDRQFLLSYERARLRAVRERDELYRALSRIAGIRVYESKGNFFLVKLCDGSTAEHLTVRLLARHGIYIRPCGDKAGLRGEFVRIASRRGSENRMLVRALRALFSK